MTSENRQGNYTRGTSPDLKRLDTRQFDISTILTTALQLGESVTPSERESAGMALFGKTSELAVPSFYNTLRSQNPSGYLTGVGAGAIFTLLYAFHKKRLPKAIIFTDIESKIIANKFLFVSSLHETSNWQELKEDFFTISFETYKKRINSFIHTTDNLILKKHLLEADTAEWAKYSPMYVYKEYELGKRNGQNSIQPIQAIKDNYSILKQLADENNIGIVYADITNPVLIEAIANLPGFSNSVNMLYISNIADFKTYMGAVPGGILEIERLKKFETVSPNSIYIDSLDSLNLYLRAGYCFPTYTQEGFRRNLSYSEIPPFLLFGQ